MTDLTETVLGCLTDVIAEVAENHRLMRRFVDDPYARHTRSLQILAAQNEQLARVTEALCSVLRGTAPETEQPQEPFDPETGQSGKLEFVPFFCGRLHPDSVRREAVE